MCARVVVDSVALARNQRIQYTTILDKLFAEVINFIGQYMIRAAAFLHASLLPSNIEKILPRCASSPLALNRVPISSQAHPTTSLYISSSSMELSYLMPLFSTLYSCSQLVYIDNFVSYIFNSDKKKHLVLTYLHY